MSIAGTLGSIHNTKSHDFFLSLGFCCGKSPSLFQLLIKFMCKFKFKFKYKGMKTHFYLEIGPSFLRSNAGDIPYVEQTPLTGSLIGKAQGKGQDS